MGGIWQSAGPLVLGVCGAGAVVAALLARGAPRESRAPADLRRSAAWFVLAALWFAGGWATRYLGVAGQSWYRDGVVGLVMGLALIVFQLLSVIALAVGVGRLLAGIGRRTSRPVQTTVDARGLDRADAVDSTGDPQGEPAGRAPSSPRSAVRAAPLLLIGVGVVMILSYGAVRGWAGDDLIVLASGPVPAGAANVLVPVGLGVALLGVWLLTLAAPFSRGGVRVPLGAEVAWMLSAGAVLLGAVIDLLIFSSADVLVLPAEAGATCDVVVEQQTFLFTGSVDVMVRPHESRLASTVLPDGHIGLEEIVPFREGGAHEVGWDEDGATVTFDASDNPGPLETVRADCP